MQRVALSVLLLAGASHGVSVVSCGAIGDGKTDNTAAFRACALRASEDGILLVPEGTFVTGAFNLTSGITLTVMGTISGIQSVDGYPVVLPLPSYGASRDVGVYRYQALIQTNGGSNININGSGVIDGNGQFWWDLHNNKMTQHGRPELIGLMNTTNIEISGVTLRNPGFWTLHPIYCKNVHIHHITVDNPANSPNTDGCDPDSCENVVVEYCRIGCGDDAIAIKSGLDAHGRAVGIPSKNITIRHNVFLSGHGVSVGSEISGGVEDILFWNNTLVGPLNIGCRIKSAPTRGAYMRNIVFKDIVIGNVGVALGIQTNYSGGAAYYPMTDMRNISFINITRMTGSGGVPPGSFECFDPPYQCNDVTLQNVHLDPSSAPWDCHNVAGLQVINVSPAGLTQQLCSANSSSANSGF